MPAQVIFGDINKLDPDELRSALIAAGITRIDTAARYQNGESEKKIGGAKFPQDFTIDTKIFTTIPAHKTLSTEAIGKSITNSLHVLGVEQVNVLYCHAPDFATSIAEQAQAFNHHYIEGRFRYLGVSNFDAEMLQEWLDIADREGFVKPTVFEGQYNLFCRSYEETLFPLLRKHSIHFIAYSPLAGGFLLGNFTAQGARAGSRFAVQTPYTKWYDTPAMHEAIKKVKAVGEKTGLGLDELSLRWLKYHSALGEEDAMILGASKPTQIEKNVAQLAKGPLEDSLAAELNAMWEGIKEDGAKIIDYEYLR
ncbi:hypothetical protein LTR85_000091 [Meristemomyces frigidus]|nr:hypothetical protein LTR85_000091 [Meristemomyces frigidus]